MSYVESCSDVEYEVSDDEQDYVANLKKTGWNYTRKPCITTVNICKKADRFLTSARQQAVIINSTLSAFGQNRSITPSGVYRARIIARYINYSLFVTHQMSKKKILEPHCYLR